MVVHPAYLLVIVYRQSDIVALEEMTQKNRLDDYCVSMASLRSHVEERRVRLDVWSLIQPFECLLATALSTTSEESDLFTFEEIPEDGDMPIVRYIGIVSVVVLWRFFEILLASYVFVSEDSVDVADDY